MSDYGSVHVGVRHEGEGVWMSPGRSWECFDRETGARIGPVHPTRAEAADYAAYRERATYSLPCTVLYACTRERYHAGPCEDAEGRIISGRPATMPRYEHSAELMARRADRDRRRHSGDMHSTGRCGYMGSLCGPCEDDETREMLAFYADAPAPAEGEWAGDYWRRIGGRFYDAWYTVAQSIARRHGVTFRVF